MFKVGYIQTSPVLGEVARNVALALEMASELDANLIVMPELFSTGYAFGNRELALSQAETADGPVIAQVVSLCRMQNKFVCGGFAERAPGGAYNSAFLAGPDGVVGIYRKTHLFHGEKDLFLPGDTGFQVFDIGEARVGMMICFDWFFPEAARTLALKGADIILHPANLVMPFCPDALVTRCLENHVFAVMSDRVGFDTHPKGEVKFTGMSEVVSPAGEILCRASRDREESFAVAIDPKLARDKRITPRSDVFQDRRPEFYFR